MSDRRGELEQRVLLIRQGRRGSDPTAQAKEQEEEAASEGKSQGEGAGF